MGVRVLDALKPFMLGMEFIPFVVAPKMDTKAKKTYTYAVIDILSYWSGSFETAENTGKWVAGDYILVVCKSDFFSYIICWCGF